MEDAQKIDPNMDGAAPAMPANIAGWVQDDGAQYEALAESGNPLAQQQQPENGQPIPDEPTAHDVPATTEAGPVTIGVPPDGPPPLVDAGAPDAPEHNLNTLEKVRALPELAEDQIAELARGPITFFKSAEGVTMRVVHCAGQFFKTRLLL